MEDNMILKDEEGNEIIVLMIGVKVGDFHKISDIAKEKGKVISELIVDFIAKGLEENSLERKG